MCVCGKTLIFLQTREKFWIHHHITTFFLLRLHDANEKRSKKKEKQTWNPCFEAVKRFWKFEMIFELENSRCIQISLTILLLFFFSSFRMLFQQSNMYLYNIILYIYMIFNVSSQLLRFETFTIYVIVVYEWHDQIMPKYLSMFHLNKFHQNVDSCIWTRFSYLHLFFSVFVFISIFITVWLWHFESMVWHHHILIICTYFNVITMIIRLEKIKLKHLLIF